jgi:hypothetical protein
MSKVVIDMTTSPSRSQLFRDALLPIAASNALWATRNGKREGRAWPVTVLRPETPVMSLDNRAADRQPIPIAPLFVV